jgi:carbon storage regulator CsrA
MLILTRRETEKVVFPTLGISIEVLRTRGTTTRLGIDAPADVPILRDELAQRSELELSPNGEQAKVQLRDLARSVRRQLDGAADSLNQLHERADTNRDELAKKVVMRLYRELQSLEQQANEAVEWTSAAKKLHVLIVEDSATERQLLAKVLELSGLNVTTANDGCQALDFLSLHAKPDAVLLDMIMPHCDGPSFVEQVRGQPDLKDLNIFAVSSLDPSTLGLDTGPDGINGWFPKPLEPGELVSALDKRLKQPVLA